MQHTLLAALHNATLPPGAKTPSSAVRFALAKWTTLAHRVQEAISQTDVPAAGDLALIRTVTRRKHLLAEARRTLDPMAEMLLDHPAAGHEVAALQRKMDRWVAELEAVQTSLSNELSLRGLEVSMAQGGRATQLTVLAFVFLPASVVAGCFGMNIDVLSDDPPVWWFFVVAAAVTAWTFLYAVFFKGINRGLVVFAMVVCSLALDASFTLWKALGILLFSTGAATLFLPAVCISLVITVASCALVVVAWLIVFVVYFATKMATGSGAFRTRACDALEAGWKGLLFGFTLLGMMGILWLSTDGFGRRIPLFWYLPWHILAMAWNVGLRISAVSPAWMEERRYWRGRMEAPKPQEMADRKAAYLNPQCTVM